jgi:hypothetical protein
MVDNGLMGSQQMPRILCNLVSRYLAVVSEHWADGPGRSTCETLNATILAATGNAWASGSPTVLRCVKVIGLVGRSAGQVSGPAWGAKLFFFHFAFLLPLLASCNGIWGH